MFMRPFIMFFLLFFSSICLLGQEDIASYDLYFGYDQLAAWPNFCCHHLSSDPEGCSSWCIVGDGEHRKYQLEQRGNFHLFPDAFIAPERINQAKAYFEYIPTLPWRRCKCDYAECLVCGRSVMRTLREKPIKYAKVNVHNTR